MHPSLAAQQPSSAPGNGCCGSLEAHLLPQGPTAGPYSQDAHVAESVEETPEQSLVAQLNVAVVVQAGVFAAVLAAVGSAIVVPH